jgi:hypothetical protein
MSGPLSHLLAPAAAFASSPLRMQQHPPPPLTPQDLHGLHGQDVTLVGFGSLLSETSSRTTFPTLSNFRLGRVQGFRRVFRHPAAIFYERGMYVSARNLSLSLCLCFLFLLCACACVYGCT